MDWGLLGIFTQSQTNTLNPLLNKETGSFNFVLKLDIRFLLDLLIETESTPIAAENPQHTHKGPKLDCLAPLLILHFYGPFIWRSTMG